MPLIPAQTEISVPPAGAPGVFHSVAASPEAFGALKAQALGGVGQSLDRSGDVLAKHALAFQAIHNETVTDEVNNRFEAAKRAVLFGSNDQPGFYTKQGKDAIDAMQPTAEQIEQIRSETREGLENREQQRMFDVMSRQATRRDLTSMELHANKEAERWREQTAKGTIGTAIDNSKAYWNDDQRFALSLGIIKIQSAKLAQQQGVDPDSDAGQHIIRHYQSEAWAARIHAVMATDAALGRQLFDANKDYIDAPHAAQLEQQLTSHEWTQMARDESVQRRRDADAEKELRAGQTATYSKYLADAISGKAPSAAQIADLVRTQQITPGAADHLLSAGRRKPPGAEEDNAMALIALQVKLHDSSLSATEKVDAITEATKNGHLKAATASALTNQALTTEARGDNAAARQSRSSLMHALGVPDGMVNISHDDARRKAQAGIEFDNRVTAGEDPVAVRDELIERYSPPGMPPASWPQPRAGAVQSTADVQRVAAVTKAAFDAGQITPEQFATEKANLVRFNQFWQREEQRRAAITAARKEAPKGGSDKAKLKGVTAGGPGNG